MEEKHLLLLALFAFLLGMSVLLFVEPNFHEGPIETAQESILVRGMVVAVEKRGSVTLVTLQREVPVVFFGGGDVRVGEYITLEGQVEKYEGEYQVVGELQEK